MIQEGLAHIRRFDWSDVAVKTEELYRDLFPVADPS
jgi:hypothetical protein